VPRRVAALLLALSLLATATAAAAGAATVVDDRGITVSLARPAARIVTLTPHLTELAYAAGAGDRLVAVARYSDYPQPARALPLIGDAAEVDLERIAALEPDLVLAWKSGNSPADVASLERLGLPVYVSEEARLDDVARVLRAIGRLAGTEPAAERAAEAYAGRLGALRARYAGRSPVRVFYEIWDRPLITVNGRHIISDVLRLCGARNVFAGAPLLTPTVSLEALVAARPQAIVGGTSAMTERDLAAEWRNQPVTSLRALPVIYVLPDLIQRQTPRIAEAAAAICAKLDALRGRKE
jgi:iron complex transport system substrate-binding protein